MAEQPQLRGGTEDLLRTILSTMADRVAGRPFRNANPEFFGTPAPPRDLRSMDDVPPDVDDELGEIDGDDLGDIVTGAAAQTTDAAQGVFRTGSLAWGGHANGRIPASEMVDIGGGHRLEADAATDWKRMVEAARKDGINISITDSYRSYDAQVDVRRRKGHLVATATPGTSNHGWGRAVDANVNDPKTLAWLRQNAHRFGWVNPPWAQKKGKSFEPWHWEYRALDSQQIPEHRVDDPDHAHDHEDGVEPPAQYARLEFGPPADPDAANRRVTGGPV